MSAPEALHLDVRASRWEVLVPGPALTIAALAAGALLAVGCSRTAAAPAALPAPAVPVRSIAVARGVLAVPVRASGTVHPKDERVLAFKVGGLVARVLVQAGDRVHRGEVLAELDATELLAGARQAQEGLAKAERDLARARSLAEQDVLPRAAAEDAESGARMARAAAAAAEFNVRRAVLTAQDDGWAEERMAEPGEVVGPGQPIVRVSGGGRGWVVRVSLPDRDVLGLRPGQAATVTLDARPGEPLAGTVSEIARTASRGTGTYEVEVRLSPDGRGELLGGLTAKVEIARVERVPAAVPLAALVDADGARGAVFAVEEGRARRVPVQIAALQGDRAILAGDLAGVVRVVTDGAASLSDGTPVKVVE
ncbi:MAG TPA: efflux RND transporter periplasmic adaptor subunit [Anaeromyxobacter sp.]|nr:efflux RND transporter periplasmic adaptor subunit [Anaeromyxobacter sp.]